METPSWPRRHNTLRLAGHDYRMGGSYAVTIRVQHGLRLFGKMVNGEMRLNAAGEMVAEVWKGMETHQPGVRLGQYVVMPNHFHGIVVLFQSEGGKESQATDGPEAAELSLGDVVSRYKSLTTRRYIEGVKTDGWRRFDGRVWQRGYYDSWLRDEGAVVRFGEYVRRNPERWSQS